MYEIGIGLAHKNCSEFLEPKIVPHTTEHSSRYLKDITRLTGARANFFT